MSGARLARWTLVTGASDGIGAEFARLAASKGRNVVLSARRGDRLELLGERLRSTYGVLAAVIPADLSKPGEAERLWREASAGRHINVLINNAGLGRNGRFGDGDEGWARERTSIEVNVVALTTLMNLAVPHMKARGRGRILNVASTAAFMPGPNMAVYHATKAYVVSLSCAVASELAGSDISVTALCPGPTKTSFFKSADMETARALTLVGTQSVEAVAKAGYIGAMRGQSVVTPGFFNKLSAWGAKVSPRAVSTTVAKFVMAKT